MGFPIPVRWHLYIESGPWSYMNSQGTSIVAPHTATRWTFQYYYWLYRSAIRIGAWKWMYKGYCGFLWNSDHLLYGWGHKTAGCLVTWFCYQLIAKPGNKTAAVFAVSWPDPLYINGLVQDCSDSSALAMELLQSCAKPSICISYMNYAHITCYIIGDTKHHLMLAEEINAIYAEMVWGNIYSKNLLAILTSCNF